jgi:hypothetical protein
MSFFCLEGLVAFREMQPAHRILFLVEPHSDGGAGKLDI